MNAPMQYENLAAMKDNTDSLEVCLVDSGSDAQESRECALQIILDLQNYYRRRNLSYQERFGTVDPLAEKVLAQLSSAYEGARQWGSGTGDASLTLSVGSGLTLGSVPR